MIGNCRPGGPSLYHGVMVNKPYTGLNKREISKNDIIKSCCVDMLVAVTAYFIVLVFLFFTYQ
jgi:adenosylcobinamide-phosphate synthase